MRRGRATMLTAAFTAAAVGTVTTGAYAKATESAKGNVTAVAGAGPHSLKFKAS